MQRTLVWLFTLGRAGAAPSDDSKNMSDNQQPHPKKKVTAATTDAPQEEFISPENIPSKPDPAADQKKSPKQSDDPPRQ